MFQGTRDRRVPLESPLRYRRIGESAWHFGKTVDTSGSGLLFICETPLKLGTEVEVILPVVAQQAGSTALLDLVYRGHVVRSVLPTEPDGRPAVAIKVSGWRIAGCHTYHLDYPGASSQAQRER